MRKKQKDPNSDKITNKSIKLENLIKNICLKHWDNTTKKRQKDE